MKNLLVLMLTLTSVTASAKSIKLYSVRANFTDEINPEFKINAKLGRAWVNIVTVQDFGDDYNEYDHYVKVDGLSYNNETKELVYSDGAEQVVCANSITRGRGIFRYTKLVYSGKCQFKHSTEYRDYDDGFYVRTSKYDVVSLEIPSL